ncbi:MAG: type II secretion system F family protein [Candidatus Hydrogenedentota bacterium]|nr:MAG: type II secretion system F family protein [Candidatus Hydrogenedentota bacterium]
MLGLIVAIITVLILAGIGLAVYMVKGAKRDVARERLLELKNFGKEEQKKALAGSFEEEQLEKPFFERVIQPILERMAGKFKKSGSKEDPVATLLIQAGNPGNLTSGQFKALKLLAAMLSVSLMGFLTLIGILPFLFGIIFMAVAAGMSFVAPQFWLARQVTVRRKKMRKQLPDMLDLLTVSVEAGLGFDQALQKVVERMEGPLPEEFDRMLQEVKIGKARKDALKSMSARCQVSELDTLISAVIQADALGVSIGQILRIQSDQLRTKRRQMVEEMAQKLPIKMLFPMIFFIFPTIFIVTLGPIGLKVFRTMGGL